MLIRVGDTIINLDNVMAVELNWEPPEEEEDDDEDDEDEDEEDEDENDGNENEGPQVVFEFIMRGMDELDQGQNVAQPYLRIFGGEEAEAIRNYLKEKVPDLLVRGKAP